MKSFNIPDARPRGSPPGGGSVPRARRLRHGSGARTATSSSPARLLVASSSSPKPTAGTATRCRPPARRERSGPISTEPKPTRDQVVQQVKTGGGGMPSRASSRTARSRGRRLRLRLRDRRPTPAPTGFKPSRSVLASCKAGDSACYLQAFREPRVPRGPGKALALLSAEDRDRPSDRVDLPSDPHTIGAGALLRSTATSARPSARRATCGSGYYHGLLAVGSSPASRRTRSRASPQRLLQGLASGERVRLLPVLSTASGHG